MKSGVLLRIGSEESWSFSVLGRFEDSTRYPLPCDLAILDPPHFRLTARGIHADNRQGKRHGIILVSIG